MKNETVFEILCSTNAGARLLIETIIEEYGVQDFLQCIFLGLNEEAQERFLNTAFQKAGAL